VKLNFLLFFFFVPFFQMMQQQLWLAAQIGYEEYAKTILNGYKDVSVNWENPGDHHLRTPLHMACAMNHVEIVALLLSHPDIQVNKKDKREITPFIEACSRGNSACVKILLDDARVALDEISAFNYSALYSASNNNHIQVVKIWIASGRELVFEGPGNWGADVVKISRLKDHHEMVSLLENYQENKEATIHRVRIEMNWYHEKAAHYFSSVVFLCDGLLKIKEGDNSKEGRFFKIVRKLPLEIQMMLCHRLAGGVFSNIMSKWREDAFRQLAKFLLK
jgi:hypothetical protein